MKTKKLKVYQSCNYRSDSPKIQLEGKWLQALGFNVGDSINVNYENGIIQILSDAMVYESSVSFKGSKDHNISL